jgi:hypothetical protein
MTNASIDPALTLYTYRSGEQGAVLEAESVIETTDEVVATPPSTRKAKKGQPQTDSPEETTATEPDVE